LPSPAFEVLIMTTFQSTKPGHAPATPAPQDASPEYLAAVDRLRKLLLLRELKKQIEIARGAAPITVEFDLHRIVAENRAADFGPEVLHRAIRRRNAVRNEYLAFAFVAVCALALLPGLSRAGIRDDAAIIGPKAEISARFGANMERSLREHPEVLRDFTAKEWHALAVNDVAISRSKPQAGRTQSIERAIAKHAPDQLKRYQQELASVLKSNAPLNLRDEVYLEYRLGTVGQPRDRGPADVWANMYLAWSTGKEIGEGIAAALPDGAMAAIGNAIHNVVTASPAMEPLPNGDPLDQGAGGLPSAADSIGGAAAADLGGGGGSPCWTCDPD
jgi:hypothetical protein